MNIDLNINKEEIQKNLQNLMRLWIKLIKRGLGNESGN